MTDALHRAVEILQARQGVSGARRTEVGPQARKEHQPDPDSGRLSPNPDLSG